MYDVYVVGAGISGCVVARHLAEKGKKVLVMERRQHIAGNLFDYTHESGIRVQNYGPHIFHTRNLELFNYLSRFGKWIPFHLKCMVYMNGIFTPSPFNYQTIDDFFTPNKAAELKTRLETSYPGLGKVTIVELLKSKDPLIKEYADFLYTNDYSLYTAKQWGISPSEIDISVLQRVPVLLNYENGYFDDPVQMMPQDGFTAIIETILDHKNITVQLDIDALSHFKVNTYNNTLLLDGEETTKHLIYTGALDELLEYRFGILPYRSLRFEWITAEVNSIQSAPVVAYPQEPDYIRITEYNKLPEQPHTGRTVYAKEYSFLSSENTALEPYYPIPTDENTQRYVQYKTAVDGILNLHLCGRLAEYKYYNIDQALERALQLCAEL